MRIELTPISGGGRRGERAILVDGICWGQTLVTSHGSRGTSTIFKELHGNVIQRARESGKGVSAVTVYSGGRRKSDDVATLEQRVIDTIRELIEQNLFRHPDAVQAEKDRRRQQYNQRVAEEAAEWRTKAREALFINDPDSDDPKIDRVVAAMKWAQSR